MVSAIRAWFRSLVDIRREEYVPLGLMLGYGFLAMTSYYVIKPARNSIFVDRVGADALPLVYVLTAVVVVGVMVLYSKYVEKVGRMTLLLSSMAALGATLVGFFLVLRGGSGVVSSGAFYIFVKLYPLFLVSQFWLVGNLLFTTAQARRLFGPIGMGLILGGIAGSSIAGVAGERLGTEPLLLVAVGILALCALLVVFLSPRIREGSGASARLTDELSKGAVKLLLESSHLKTIAWILGLTIVVGTLLDWQLNRAVEIYVEGEDAKTAFFGGFYAFLNVASVAIQLFFTSFVLRRFGVGVALFVLPVALGVASAGVLAVPVLYMVAVAKGAEGALRYSLDQSTRELIWLPVPTDEKYKVKPLIDLAVYRGGTGFGGLLLLLFVNALGVPLRWISVVTIAVIAWWLWHAWRMRKEFADSLKRLIGVRDVRLEELLVRHLGSETRKELESVLERGDEEEVLYALSLLEQVPSSQMAGALRELLDHESQEVRGRAVELLTQLEAAEVEEAVRELLDDPSSYVRAEAIHYLCQVADDDPARAMDDFLEDERPEVAGAAVRCLVRRGSREERERGVERIREMAEGEDVERRRSAVVLLGQLEDPPEAATELLEEMADDEDVTVALHAMRAMGWTGDTEHVPLLLDRLRDPETRAGAAEALGDFCPGIHPELLDLLEDEEEALDTRVRIPDLLVPELDQDGADRLWRILPSLDRTLRYHALKALSKLRRDRDDLSFEEWEVQDAVEAELADSARALLWFEDLKGDEDRREPADLLEELCLQRWREGAERAVRILALHLPQEDLYAAYQAWSSSQDVSRQRGFELLDTLVPQEYRTLFDPLLKPDTDPRQRAEMVAEVYGLERGGEEETLERIEAEGDLWLAVLARKRRGGQGLPERDEPLDVRIRADAPVRGSPTIPIDEEQFMDVLERGEILGKAKIFRDLRTEDLAAVAALTEEQEWEAEQVLFEEGESGGTLYVVASGRVRAAKGGRTLFEAGPGRSVGSLSLLDGLPTDYTATALEDTTTLTLEREPFQTLLTERGPAMRAVLGYVTGVVRGLNEAPDGEGEEEAEDRRRDGEETDAGGGGSGDEDGGEGGKDEGERGEGESGEGDG